MSYKAPLMEMLGLMIEDKEESKHLKNHLEDNMILEQAIKDKGALDKKEVSREELAEFYLRGFTGGEVLDGYSGSLSKQGLYNRVKKIDNNYQQSHKEARGLIQEQAEQYFFFNRPNMTGTMGYVRDKYHGKGYSTIYEEYMHNGGIAPEYDEQHESDSVYIDLYPQLANGERPEGVEDSKYKAMLAGFYRFRKDNVDKAVILGDLASISWLQPTPEYVQKRTQAVNKRILDLGRLFTSEQNENPTQAILVVYIEHKMEVYGDVARNYYKGVLEQEGLEVEEPLNAMAVN